MFREIASFEIRYHLRQPVFWVAFAFFFLITFLATSTDAVVIGGALGKINRNAPFVIMQMMLIMSIIGVFFTTAFVASPVLRDVEHRTQGMFFSTPLKKRDYLLGRFTGAYVISLALFVSVALGIFLGSSMPWIEPERVGPVLWQPYLFSLAVLVAPNLLLTGALFFSIATWTRSMLWTYVGVLAMFVGYGVAGALASDVDSEMQAVYLDPFGGGAFSIATKYWTVAERNSQVLPLDGPLLANRLLWLGVALVLFAFTCWRFRMAVQESKKAKKTRRAAEREAPAEVGQPAVPDALGVRSPQVFGLGTAWSQLLHQTRFEMGAVFRGVAFPIIAGFGVLNMIGNSVNVDALYGTAVYPVTHLMVMLLQQSFLFMFIVVVFYSGEVVWRERGLELSDVYDALPTPTWAVWGGKALALGAVVVSLLVVSILTGISIQAWRGYFDFELGLYLQGLLFLVGVSFLLWAVLALFLQTASNHRYLGMLLMILVFIASQAMPAWDWDHHLYRFGEAPGAPYSDMNGYGRFLEPVGWFYLYWGFFAVILLALMHLLWVRGREGGLKTRLLLARRRLTRPVAAVLAAATLGFLAVGGYIFYNTNVLNEYVPGDVTEERQARFEKLYKRYEDLPQPKITSVYAEVDIYPEERDVAIRGTYELVNKTDEPLAALHLTVDPEVTIEKLEMPGARLDEADDELGYYVYELSPAMAPGEARTLGYELAVVTRGFRNHGAVTSVVENGTFFNNFQYFPNVGYNPGAELQDPNDRRKHGLEPIQRMPDLDDADARQANYLTAQADWLDFETVVCTSADQIALAPGYLEREWQEDGRRCFHYAMDAPILGFWAYLSADWQVERDSWNGVAIEVYYDEKHPYNVRRMIEAVKDSLDYFTENFGPYQHRQVRIVEFPRYARFAQSFPNTIPFSESIGFIARLEEDPEAIDYVYYVTAHEVAHQWWAHQVIGGAVQGATVLSETLSQYSALMVMKHEYGPEHMRKFLKYELDSYLRGRGGELVEELPLMRVENQGYVHYRKGSLVMYALQDMIGEQAVNHALSSFLDETKFQEPPYTYTRELLAHFEEVTPERYQPFLSDLFETITLWDNKATEAVYRQRDDGKYVVEVTVAASKLEATGQGAEEEVPVSEWVDVGVFGEKGEGDPAEGKVLALEKRHLTEKETVVELVVDEKPVQAGVDPFNKLIDRNPEDNLTSIEAGSAADRVVSR